MTEAQTWTGLIGILAAAAAMLIQTWRVTGAQFRALESKIDARFDATDARFDAVDARMDALRYELRADIAEIRVDVAWLKGGPPGPRAV